MFSTSDEEITIIVFATFGRIKMVWKPGQTGNANGRPRKYPEPPPGVNAKDFYGLAAQRDEYRNIAESHGLEDPILFQHKLLQDNGLSIGLRATIAAAIAPYYRPRLGIQSPPRMIEVQVDVPEFKSVEEAELFLNKLTKLVGAGELSLPTALDLGALVRGWIHSRHADMELEIKSAAQGNITAPQVIRIEGGLPSLPGSDVTMPQLNGHGAEGLLPPHPYIDSAPVDVVPDGEPLRAIPSTAPDVGIPTSPPDPDNSTPNSDPGP